MQHSKLWDIFCRVIDNYGDVGVCWRLCTNLAKRGQRVRLWVDDPRPLNWMAPGGEPRVEVHPWTHPFRAEQLSAGDVLVEAFGCEIAPEFIALYADGARARGINPLWINLEYLSAEAYVERCHGLPSPVLQGPGAGLTKHFFFPGFTPATGGLLRESELLTRQAGFDKAAWLKDLGLPVIREHLVTLFCYEPPLLPQLLDLLAKGPSPSRLLVTAGRATAAVQQTLEEKKSVQPLWNKDELLSISYLPFLTQREFDHLLWSSDLNFVRGEDSVVRALWAGRPFVWQIYPQEDDAQHAKLQAFLDMAQMSGSLRDWHMAWNGMGASSPLPTPDLSAWQQKAMALRANLLAQDDLASKLLRFASESH